MLEYLDETTDTLYIKVPVGTDIKAAEVIVPNLETLVETAPNKSGKIHNLAFEGITFRYSNWTVMI